MFERLRYRVNVKGQLIKNSFIHHSFEAINGFLQKNAVFWFKASALKGDEVL